MPTLTLLVGIPRSGKSTWRSGLEGVFIVNPDEIRLLVAGEEFDERWEPTVWTVAFAMTESALTQGFDVVVDATNVTERRRAPFVALAKRIGAPVVARVFPVPLELALERNRRADRRVPEHVIRRKFHAFAWPTPEEGIDEIIVHHPVESFAGI